MTSPKAPKSSLKDDAEKHGFSGYYTIGLEFEGQLSAVRGDVTTAERLLRAALAGLRKALRIKGEVLLLSDKADTTAAEDHFRRSSDLARRQGALSWELRTAMSLARLQRAQGHIGEARDLLARCMAASPKVSELPICNRQSGSSTS